MKKEAVLFDGTGGNQAVNRASDGQSLLFAVAVEPGGESIGGSLGK
jgi:hypothetical protein